MNVLPWLRFIDELSLKNQRQRLFASRRSFRKGKRFAKGFEGVVVIAAFELIRCPAIWMTPNAVFQHFVPDVAATGFRSGGVLSNLGWIENSGRIER